MTAGQKARLGKTLVVDNLTVTNQFATTDTAIAYDSLTAHQIDFTGGTPSDHVINMSGITLAASTNAIRGASVNPTRTSGWISFSGTVSTGTFYSDYRELHTTGTAEVLGFGSFPYMDSGSTCASMFAGQDIAFVSTGATVTTAAGTPGVGVFARSMKTVIDGASFNSAAVAATAFMSFQANVTSVGALDTSIINMEVASGQVGAIFRIRKTAAAIARALFWFDSAAVAPIVQTVTLFTDPNAATCEKGLHVRIGNVSYMIPLYVSDSGGIVTDW